MRYVYCALCAGLRNSNADAVLYLPPAASTTSSKLRKPGRGALTSTAILPVLCWLAGIEPTITFVRCGIATTVLVLAPLLVHKWLPYGRRRLRHGGAGVSVLDGRNFRLWRRAQPGDPEEAARVSYRPPAASTTSSKLRRPARGALTSTAMLPGLCWFFHII